MNQIFSRLYTLIVKEFLAVWRDKKSRFILIIPPLLQLFIFTFAATLDVKQATIGILNLDNGNQGYELCQRFLGSPVFTSIIFLKSEEEIASFIDNSKGFMVVSIDQEFSKNLNRKETTNVQLIMDGRKSNTTQIIAGYASTIIQDFNNRFNCFVYARHFAIWLYTKL